MDHSIQPPVNNNQSTDKVLAILELLSYSSEPLRLIDIAHRLKFNSSTALRFLNSLEQNGYVYKDKETLKYRMTYKICGLAGHVIASISVTGPVGRITDQFIRENLSSIKKVADEISYQFGYQPG